MKDELVLFTLLYIKLLIVVIWIDGMDPDMKNRTRVWKS